MKIVISSFDNDIVLSDEYTQVLEISDKTLFSKISQSFYSLCAGEEAQESILLFDKDNIKDFSKYSLFLASPLLLDIDCKSIQTKLHDIIHSFVIQDPERSIEINRAYNELLSNFISFTYDLDLPIDWSSAPDWYKILKCMNPKIDVEKCDSVFERLLLYLEVISNLNLTSFLILCNFKNFFTNDQLVALYKTSRYYSIPLLLIESNHADNILDGERKIWVDDDFVELLCE